MYWLDGSTQWRLPRYIEIFVSLPMGVLRKSALTSVQLLPLP